MFEVPRVVQNKAIAAEATDWLDEIPNLVANLETAWSFQAGRPLDGGTESFVVEVLLHDGTPAVLKLLLPRDREAAANEITALRLADGDGCAQLLQMDEARGALLLERLGRSLYDLSLPIQRRHEILCSVAARVWRPAPDCGLPTGAAKGRWLIDFITGFWEAQARPCSERAIEYSIRCAQRRIAAHDDQRAVLVHGDVHQWNALEASDGFKLVDPDGLLAEAEYDMGIVMREDPEALLHGDPWERAHRLAALTKLDPRAIWEWGVVERVSTGLLCNQVDWQPVGRLMLKVADRVAE